MGCRGGSIAFAPEKWTESPFARCIPSEPLILALVSKFKNWTEKIESIESPPARALAFPFSSTAAAAAEPTTECSKAAAIAASTGQPTKLVSDGGGQGRWLAAFWSAQLLTSPSISKRVESGYPVHFKG